jgi:hypothetical protein
LPELIEKLRLEEIWREILKLELETQGLMNEVVEI